MTVEEPPVVAVDANLLARLFSRYLFLALHKWKVCEVVYSNLLWEEVAETLRRKLGLSGKKVKKTRKYLEAAGFRKENLDFDDRKKIDLLEHVNEKDRHVLYLAFISKSSFLVTADRKFRREDINHEDHQRLEFYYPVEAVSLDEFLCTLMEEDKNQEDRHANFLDAVQDAMVYMRSYSVDKIFSWLKSHCPNTHSKLFPRFEEIEAAVEAGRKAAPA